MILQNNTDFYIKNVTAQHDELPVGVYNLNFNDISKEFYLGKIPDFTLPKKLYGDVKSFGNRIIKKYNSTTHNVGVLLVGVRGAGKTITSKYICNKLKRPVIIIPEGYDSTDFVQFITNPVFKDCIIFIDEFEKLYDSAHKNVDSDILLSLLDGPYSTHHLYLFTANSMYGINPSMKNRPSRIHFLKEYGSISEEAVLEVANDLLDNKSYINELLEVATLLPEVSYDTIFSIIEDCNLYNEPPKECVKHLNMIFERIEYSVTQYIDGYPPRNCGSVILKNQNDFGHEYVWIYEVKDGKMVGLTPEFQFTISDYVPVENTLLKKIYRIEEMNSTVVLNKVENKIFKLF